MPGIYGMLQVMPAGMEILNAWSTWYIFCVFGISHIGCEQVRDIYSLSCGTALVLGISNPGLNRFKISVVYLCANEISMG